MYDILISVICQQHMPEIHTFESTVLEKIQLTSDVIELCFSKPDNFTYTAGQFLQCLIPDSVSQCVRSYSLSSKPTDTYLEFCIKLLPDGKGSSFFRSLDCGDRFAFKGPFGRFSLSDTSQHLNLTCIATGVGIAPIFGIIDDQLRAKKTNQKIQLLFGVRDEGDIFWLDRFETLHRDVDTFSYIVTLSQPSSTWDANTGRVTEHLNNISHTDTFFICGSPAMVKDVRTKLLEQKVNPAQIHFEIF